MSGWAIPRSWLWIQSAGDPGPVRGLRCGFALNGDRRSMAIYLRGPGEYNG